MPYKDHGVHKAYQKKWMADRRAEYFDGKKCVKCGTTEDLELHHRNPEDKTSHRIWSWTKEKREAELAKCDPMCNCCHKEHHRSRGETHFEDKPPYL